MAKIVQAVRKYGPKLERQTTVELEELFEWMARHSGMVESELSRTVLELYGGILHFNRQGRAVKLPNIGTFSPGMDRTGTLRTNFRMAVRLRKNFADINGYNGRIKNKSRIGWSDAAYKAFWDEQHPDDPLEI